ncbi:hypothetical protein [Ramlibacter pallidus]|uniref:Uncharacterized protein n=1 Tax=Ramlibacter pallidus TaxID=2780087 RepID=A0ABR9S8K7_9BURK|nr:hypothetical protein [Ramlibacter pallidus]MBE7369880.1 hypothetical protein [Ramlibacter pallidus]
MYVKVPKVKQVGVAWTKMLPPGLLVTATAHVTQVGWSNIQLVPRIYITPPADGIWDMDLVGELPDIIVMMYRPADIPARPLHIPNVPRWVQGVRVHASLNSMTSGERDAEFEEAVANWVPFPWEKSMAVAKGDPGDGFPWVSPQ